MTVLPRLPSAVSKSRRSSFVAPSGRLRAVPDALSWRPRLDGAPAPLGPAAWAAASVGAAGRTRVDAGPYGVVDLAPPSGADEQGERMQLGVVWWDRRSLHDEDRDGEMIQTAFVPAPIGGHVSLVPGPPATPRLPPPGAGAFPARRRHVDLVPRGAARRPTSTDHPRRARLRRRRVRRRVVLGVVLIAAAFVLTVLIQTLVVTPFTVPSASMQDTLHPEDRIAVDRLAYRQSIPDRGDVVVFTDPGGWLSANGAGPERDYLVKRVIGVPGDHVACCTADGRLTVNGVEVDEHYAVVPEGEPAVAEPFDATVPAGDLWVLGDNRYHSRDSSRTQQLRSRGFVPIVNVVGRAAFTVWPLDRFAPIGSARETFGSLLDRR